MAAFNRIECVCVSVWKHTVDSLTIALQKIDNLFGQLCSFEAYQKNKMSSTALYRKLRETPVIDSEREKENA